MPNRRSFKTDESFLEKLAIGAISTRAVFAKKIKTDSGQALLKKAF